MQHVIMEEFGVGYQLKFAVFVRLHNMYLHNDYH